MIFYKFLINTLAGNANIYTATSDALWADLVLLANDIKKLEENIYFDLIGILSILAINSTFELINTTRVSQKSFKQ